MDPNKERFVWGIIVAEWKPGNPTPNQLIQIGKWCKGYDTIYGTEYALYPTKAEAEKFAKQRSMYHWLFTAKKYPIHRKP